MTATATTLRFDIKLPRLGYSLNARVHWAERARVTGLLKGLAWAVAHEASHRAGWPYDHSPALGQRLERRFLQFHVVWPRYRKGPLCDDDALSQMLKPVLDGIARVLLVDDSPKWCDYRKPTQEKGSHTGYVLVRVEVGPA